MELYVRKQCGKVLHIVDPVLRSNFYYICTPTHAEFVKVVKDKLNIDVEDHNSAEGECLFIETEDNNICILWTCKRTPAIVAHEVLHAIFALFRLQNIPLNESTEEIFSLAVQYLLGAILCPQGKKKK